MQRKYPFRPSYLWATTILDSRLVLCVFRYVQVHTCMCVFVFQASFSIAVLLCETESLMNLGLADCPDWLASGSQKSLGSASPVLEFRAYVTMPGLLCVCRVSKLGSQACSVSSSTWLSWKEAAFLTPLLLGPLSSWLGTCVCWFNGSK